MLAHFPDQSNSFIQIWIWSRARGVVKRAFALHCKNGGENVYIFVILNIFEMSAPRLGCKRKLQFRPILPNVTPIQSQRFCGFGNNIAFTQRKDSNENLQPQFNHACSSSKCFRSSWFEQLSCGYTATGTEPDRSCAGLCQRKLSPVAVPSMA